MKYHSISCTNNHYFGIVNDQGNVSISVLMPDEQIKLSWLNWEKNLAFGENESRGIALDRVMQCLQYKTTELDLSGLNLISLPEELPNHITKLNISSNKLKKIPEKLPKELTHLYASNNDIESFSRSIPISLTFIDVECNNIRYIPDMYRSISEEGVFKFDKNPIIERNVNEFYNLNNASPYNGCHLDFLMPQPKRLHVTDYIEEYFKGENKAYFLKKWKSIESNKNEKNDIHLLVTFFNYISAAMYSEENSEIQYQIDKVIANSAKDKNIRKALFNITKETMINCHPQAITGYLDMVMLSLECDIKHNYFGKSFEQLEFIMNKLHKKKEIAEILKLNNFFREDKRNIIDKTSVFYFLCREFDLEEINQTEYMKKEIEAYIKPMCFFKKLLDGKFHDITFHDRFLISSPFMAYVKKINYGLCYRTEKRKKEFMSEGYNYTVMERLNLLKRKENTPLHNDVLATIGKQVKLDSDCYFGSLIMDKIICDKGIQYQSSFHPDWKHDDSSS